MPNSEPITVIYEDGVLRPRQPLTLRERQEVQILVLADEETAALEEERFHQLQRKLDAWQVAHPAQPMQMPPASATAQRARLDEEFDQLLGDLRRYSQVDSEDEVAAIVDEAVSAVRRNRRRR